MSTIVSCRRNMVLVIAVRPSIIAHLIRGVEIDKWYGHQQVSRGNSPKSREVKECYFGYETDTSLRPASCSARLSTQDLVSADSAKWRRAHLAKKNKERKSGFCAPDQGSEVAEILFYFRRALCTWLNPWSEEALPNLSDRWKRFTSKKPFILETLQEETDLRTRGLPHWHPNRCDEKNGLEWNRSVVLINTLVDFLQTTSYLARK